MCIIGLPNTFGEYDESPEVTASSLKVVSFVFWPVCLLQARFYCSEIRSQFFICPGSLFVCQPLLPYLPKVRPKFLMWKDISRYYLNILGEILNQKKYLYFLS